MPSSRKKVIVRTAEDALHPGYLPLSGLAAGGMVELLDLDGRILPLALGTVHWIAFVRDFNLADTIDPERLTRRTFLARPRTEGLWLRLTLMRGGVLEGLAALDRTLLDGLVDDRGLFMAPPDVRSNTQRIYLPRSAIAAVHLLAVITNPSRKSSRKQPGSGRERTSAQPSLFPEPRSR